MSDCQSFVVLWKFRSTQDVTPPLSANGLLGFISGETLAHDGPNSYFFLCVLDKFTTCRYSPQQNAIERDNHTVVQLVHVLLYSNKNPTHSLGRSNFLRRLHSQPRPLFRKPYQNTIRAMVRTQSGCLQPASLCIRALRLHPEPTATEVRR